MSAILAIIGSDGRVLEDAQVARMLGRMSRRGSAHASVWREGGVVLAVSRNEWELGPAFSGPALVVQDGDLIVAADASIYYRDDLSRNLADNGVQPKGSTPSHLILAAYKAFGERCPEILEGDFSFVIWDRKTRKVFCSRDYAGLRPLFYAELSGSLVIASKIGGIVEHPNCHAELNLPAIAVDAGALVFSGSLETCYRGVFTVEAGSSLSRTGTESIRRARWWNPTRSEPLHSASIDEAAEELTRLLGIAVTERADPSGATAIWLSGGSDSTAVFAAGHTALKRTPEAGRLRAVSLSFPDADSDRDDDRITAIAAMWNVPVHWIKVSDIPILDGPARNGSVDRDEPYAHLYEQIVRVLARGCREVNSRVALNGHGGDFLFQVSPVYLADLLARGRLIKLLQDWKGMKIPSHRARHFFEWAVQPLLSDTSRALLARVRRRHLRGYFERSIPLWMRTPFARAHDLEARAREGSPRTSDSSHAAYETYWYLTQPSFPRMNGLIAESALEEGVEMRIPLYDRRVIDLALSRPIAERNSRGEQKLLLRHAMRGLLPVEVLQPRPVKNGTLASYLSASMRAAVISLDETLQSPMLSEMGIVNPAALKRAAGVFTRRSSDGFLGEQLFATIQTELWLQARVGRTTMQRNQSDPWSDCASQPSLLGN